MNFEFNHHLDHELMIVTSNIVFCFSVIAHLIVTQQTTQLHCCCLCYWPLHRHTGGFNLVPLSLGRQRRLLSRDVISLMSTLFTDYIFPFLSADNLFNKLLLFQIRRLRRGGCGAYYRGPQLRKFCADQMPLPTI